MERKPHSALVKYKPKRIGLIGLPVLQSVNNLTNASIAHHAEEANKWHFVMSAEPSVAAFQFLRRLDCDGAIVRIMSPAMKREAMKIHFPLVNVSSWMEDPGVPTVRHDYDAIGRLTAEHLLEKGFRRVGCVLVAGGSYIQARYQSFTATLRKHGVKPVLFNLQTTQPMKPQPITPEERVRFTEWVRTFQPPAALALMDDWDAPVLMEACRQAGYEIPRDMVVISTGFHSEMLPLCPVPLSAAQEDQGKQAELAIQCLDHLMAGKKLSSPLIVVPPIGVVERASTATLAIEDRQVALAVDYIRAHGLEPVNVTDVVSRVHISRVTLERHFRKITGKTLHEYLVDSRIRRAKELLLAAPPPSLRKVARDCGFSDRRRLNQVFKQFVGLSPAEWQQQESGRKSPD
jgi:LacI family transcriptional regulator